MTTIDATNEHNKEDSRPYEFGFNIEGYQHRHESKNENGIVMGEFGFITADGVYHVTAYATDENGNFKILFMKNIKIGLPGNQSTSALQLPIKPPNQRNAAAPLPDLSIQKDNVPHLESATRSCSGCAIPSAKLNKQNKQPNLSARVANSLVGSDGTNTQFDPNLNLTEKFYNRPNLSAFSNGNRKHKAFITTDHNIQQKAQNKPNLFTSKTTGRSPGSMLEKRPKFEKEKPNEKNGSAVSTTQSSRRKIAVNSMQNLSKRTSFKNLKAFRESNGGSRQFLKVGIDSSELEKMRTALSGLLYKFNYTVGYHGHHESGYFEGSKDGKYYFIGRDGMRRNVQYVANNFGYQPYLTQDREKKGNIPKEATEKEAGLQGYEFKWFSERE